MFLRSPSTRSWYTASGEQRARGPYLLLLSYKRELRAVVRSVELRQLGHFMMGRMQFKPRGQEPIEVSLSGAYGSDGLPKDAADGWGSGAARLWAHAVPVPVELAEAYWHSDGHNGPGSEAPAMRAWATDPLTLRALRRAGR